MTIWKNIKKKARKIVVITAMCCFSFFPSLGQTSSSPGISTVAIKGTIVDSVNETGLGLVSIVVKEEGVPVKIVVSEENGSFAISKPSDKSYQLILSYVGYKTKSIELPASSTIFINLGKIILTPGPAPLKEVQVESQRPLVEQDIDKITYNVEADPESQILTALEILRKIPMLTTDADDNLQLNGSSSFQVLINGKTASLFVHNAMDILKIMPASSIKAVEFITSPSSKYEAEGLGVINIITYRRTIGGYNGSVNLGVNSQHGSSLNGFLTAQAGKLGLSGQFGSAAQSAPESHIDFFREDDSLHNRLKQTGEMSYNSQLHYAGGELSYVVSAQDLLTATYMLSRGHGNSVFNQQTELLNAAGQVTQAYLRENNTGHQSHSSDVTLNYERSFKKNKAQSLILSYKWGRSSTTNKTSFALEPLINYNERVSQTNNDEGLLESILQADYVQPIKKQTLELGIKSMARSSSSDYLYRDLDRRTGIFELDSLQTNQYAYREKIDATYLALNLKKGKWGIKAGARLEKTKVEASFKISGAVVVQAYSNLIPSVNLFRILNGSSMLKLSYTQRIERPGLYFLNPYIDATDPRNIRYGNPGLRPANSHVFSLSYNTSLRHSYFTFDLTHSFTNNSIQQITQLGADTIARTSFDNTGRNKATRFSLAGNFNLLKKLSMNFNSITSYIVYSGSINGMSRTCEGWAYNLSGTLTYSTKGWRFNGIIGCNSALLSLQGKAAGNMWSNASVNKTLLKNNKASIGFAIKSLFQKSRTSSTETSGPSFYQFQQTHDPIRYYTLLFNYNFGKVQGGHPDR